MDKKITTFKRLNTKLLYANTSQNGNRREFWLLKVKNFEYRVTLAVVAFNREGLPPERILFVDFTPLKSTDVYDKNVKYQAKEVITAIVTMITNTLLRLRVNIVAFYVLNSKPSLRKIYQRYANVYGKAVDCPKILEYLHGKNPYVTGKAELFSFYVR